SCPSYKPWHNKKTGQTYLKPDQGKCLHYYFYLIDEDLGLCYVRVPTWCPFRLQIYFNGHNYLASALEKHSVKHSQVDNMFINLESFKYAQEINRASSKSQTLIQAILQTCPGHLLKECP
ncbi:MAG: hypothetical protein V2I50_11950, partial [Desulfuromusa sp.]|nr:hypothetical protein [Desulfuromusa sp.]